MSSEKLFEQLVADPLLAPFFDEKFNPEAYVRSVVRQVRLQALYVITIIFGQRKKKCLYMFEFFFFSLFFPVSTFSFLYFFFFF